MKSRKGQDLVSKIKEQGKYSTPGGARTKEQYEEMKETEKKGVCTFCNRSRWKERPFCEGNYWLIKPNEYPYEHHFIHWVIIWSAGHLEDIQAVPHEAWEELAIILNFLYERHSLPAINFVMRFGDPDLRSSTIHHLHGHIQIPEDDVLPDDPPAILNIGGAPRIETFSECVALDDPGGAPHQVRKVLFVSTSGQNTLADFPALIIHSLQMIRRLKIQGGGIVFRIGDRRYTNGKFDVPYVTIYAPDGTGRVHAIFVPSPTGKGNPICKATFCKGVEGEELDRLLERMKSFIS